MNLIEIEHINLHTFFTFILNACPANISNDGASDDAVRSENPKLCKYINKYECFRKQAGRSTPDNKLYLLLTVPRASKGWPLETCQFATL